VRSLHEAARSNLNSACTVMGDGEPSLSFPGAAVCGGLSGMVTDLVFFPIDTVKTRLQARRASPGAPPPPPVSLRAVYRGLLSAMVGSSPAAATFWMTYETSKSVFRPFAQGYGADSAGVAAAAALAEVAAVAVRNPFELVKQQMQAGAAGSTVETVRAILSTSGVGGLYAGVGATVLRDIPFNVIQFGLYEGLKSALVAERGGRELVLWENGGLGMFAGGVAAAATTPLDVVKTRLMTQGLGGGHAPAYTSVVDVFTRVVREEGAGALLAGLRPRVIWISFGGAVFIGSFEELKRRVGGM
jgi:solute carrier family 25 S-adenosylmethionine transporter 26